MLALTLATLDAHAAAPTWSGPVTVRPCEAPPAALPADVERVLQGVVVVDSAEDTGSGVVISPDGFVLTAAHVVGESSTVELRFRSGLRLPADVLRVDDGDDVALLRAPGSGYACLPVGAVPPLGTDLYVIGSPLGEGLEFSVSRGIVGGIREVAGLHLIQTDATINTGNSGGPLVDPSGRVVGIVTAKLVGDNIEGIDFGAPADRAARVALEIVDGAQSSEPAPTLVGRRPVSGARASAEPYVPPPTGSFPSSLDRPLLRGGAAVAALGWALAGVSTALAVTEDPQTSHRIGQIGGLAAAVGGSAVIVVGARRAR